jgi:hypothetical protein
MSDFITAPGFGSSMTWVDFTGGQWPAVSIGVPASGQIKVTISAGNIKNDATSISTIRIGYRLSGSDTVTADPLGSKEVASAGDGDLCASRQTTIDGLTPGGTVTVTPQWRISSGSSSTATIEAGQLVAEPA